MNPITVALMSALEATLLEPAPIGAAGQKKELLELDKTPGLRDGFLDAPKGTLYIELSPDAATTRSLWAELLEAGAEPPMTAITPGEGNGVAVLLMPTGIEFYIMEDGTEPGQLIAQLSPSAGKPARWEFQRG